jgi:hypothetical protein
MDSELRKLERLIQDGDPEILARYIHAHYRLDRDHPIISTINVGVDYSSGLENRSPEGHRYGLISQDSLA